MKTKTLLFLNKNKVFIAGLIVAALSASDQLFKQDAHASTWALLWSVSIAAFSFLANNLRGQYASIFSMILSGAYAFYQSHSTPDISFHDAVRIYAMPLAINLLGMFFTSPPKNRSYEHDPIIEAAKFDSTDASLQGVGPKQQATQTTEQVTKQKTNI